METYRPKSLIDRLKSEILNKHPEMSAEIVKLEAELTTDMNKLEEALREMWARLNVEMLLKPIRSELKTREGYDEAQDID